ncbi:DUF5103 domain-containing protein [Echinicola strongylocentroti]|uniref:DUF5103 domain-containing protein n=1 Tax=Echinicola strongylocentroti TaxID=1795355 RepID=A0A2Z4IMN8_9BACT|nr:DUF5103 domain-containing protein [Echinicola strongylocentroti]AWW31989.1 DUF5103 domain-containing protein [Echinicola strongylocentroti]
MRIVIVLFFLMGSLCSFCLAQEALENKVYEENIQTVQLYRSGGNKASQMNAPIISLGGGQLVLEFDDLAFEPDRYAATLIHCDADWTPSGLKSADYLQRYNEFNITEYDYSINTRIPYVHFTFPVPQVTKSGNYILKVYRGRNEDEVIITRRFMVYQDQAKVGVQLLPPTMIEDRMSGQQIDILVNYGARELKNPLENVQVVVRQNQRWDNAKVGEKPSFIRQDKSQLEYRFFAGENIFDAGNEFRFIDLRYVRTTGRNIASIEMKDDVVYASAALNEPRSTASYFEYLDLNGQYIVENLERGNPKLESEYVLVTFSADMGEVVGEPYLFGALTNWGRSPQAKMTKNESGGQYRASVLLKQGWYDYQIAVKKEGEWNTSLVEGSHFQTENEYDVLVYYRDFGSRYDELIGYTSINANKRRF